MDEVIGEQNNLVPANAVDIWPRAAAAEIHACMEYWYATSELFLVSILANFLIRIRQAFNETTRGAEVLL